MKSKLRRLVNQNRLIIHCFFFGNILLIFLIILLTRNKLYSVASIYKNLVCFNLID